MGAWGPGLYQDDVALDIKEQYVGLLHKGKTKEEANKDTIESNWDFLNDDEDAIPMLLALADIEWKYGKLMPEVKEDALNIINSGIGLEAWKEDKTAYRKRKEVLEKLKAKLESPQPLEKQIKIPKSYKCEWKIGDTFAYKLESDLSKEKGLYGRYLIFIKVDERRWYPEHIIPQMWVKITNDETLPQNEEQLNDLEFIQTSYDLYSDLFFRTFAADKKTRNEVINFKYPVNDRYQLAEYRVSMITTSKRIIPKKLMFLGNYESARPPKDEYLAIDKFYPTVRWARVEEQIIDSYLLLTKDEVKSDPFVQEQRKNEKKFLEENGYDFNRLK